MVAPRPGSCGPARRSYLTGPLFDGTGLGLGGSPGANGTSLLLHLDAVGKAVGSVTIGARDREVWTTAIAGAAGGVVVAGRSAKGGSRGVDAALVGELDTSTWDGLAASFSAGLKMYGPAPGVYGNTGLLTFEANGRGWMGILQLSETDGSAHWGRTDMRWALGARDGKTIITVTAEYEDATEKSFEYLLRTGEPHFGAPNFVLELQRDPDAPGALQAFDTYPSECEA